MWRHNFQQELKSSEHGRDHWRFQLTEKGSKVIKARETNQKRHSSKSPGSKITNVEVLPRSLWTSQQDYKEVIQHCPNCHTKLTTGCRRQLTPQCEICWSVECGNTWTVHFLNSSHSSCKLLGWVQGQVAFCSQSLCKALCPGEKGKLLWNPDWGCWMLASSSEPQSPWCGSPLQTELPSLLSYILSNPTTPEQLQSM